MSVTPAAEAGGRARRLLVLSSPVAPIGDPRIGGVGRFLESLTAAAYRAGLEVEVLAPEGSAALAGATVVPVAGTLQPTASAIGPGVDWPVMPEGVMAAMCEEARRRQHSFDAILNVAHDWLPYYLTPFFATPLLHVPNLAHSCAATDGEIARLARSRPERVAFLSRFQAGRFGAPAGRRLAFGLATDVYAAAAAERARARPAPYLAWAGRIVPEKGLLRAAGWAMAAELPLFVAGHIADEDYWQAVLARYGEHVRHVGFLDQPGLAAFLAGAEALLQSQDWEEALGIVTLESILSGTPVLALDKGANGEVVEAGLTGALLSAAADASAAAEALAPVRTLDRDRCRAHAARHCSLDAMAASLDAWLAAVAPAPG
jgi:UDP-glucose:tetrahydrobiopterin glucosyltransferase